MKKSHLAKAILIIALLIVSACTKKSDNNVVVDVGSSTPGGTVTLRGATVHLSGTPLRIGNPLPATILIDAFTMQKVDLAQLKGRVLMVSLVPSLDTKVCEVQTHHLAELASRLPADIIRITISRDTPFAQKRFAEEAKLTGITYLSDYREGAFGRSTGLLQEDSMLLARAVILVDKAGIVRYIQVVPELSHLPDMETLLTKANALSAGR